MKNVLSVRVFKFFVERMFFCTLLGVFLTIFLGICFEDEVLAVSYKMMYLNPSVEIIYDGKTQGFYDVSGKTVYPISYEGTTYLPVRAISSLFNMRITWDGNKNAIYMSTEPAEGLSENAKTIDEFVPGESTLITALLNDEIVISFDGEVKTFEDVNKKRVYPISYQGTTYLPVRAISNLYNANIEWNGENKQILISKPNLMSGDKIVNTDEIDTSGSEIFDYDATYINNENHFAEISFEKISSKEVMFEIKGVRLSGASYMARYPLKFEKGIATCEELSLKVYLTKDSVILKTDEYPVLNGTYKIEGVEPRTIVISNLEESRWNGYFKKSETIDITLAQTSDTSVMIGLTKMGAESMPIAMELQTLSIVDNNTLSETVNGMGKIKTYKVEHLENGMLKVTINTDDLIIDELFNGIYIREEITPRELYLKLKESLTKVDMGEGITGHIML